MKTILLNKVLWVYGLIALLTVVIADVSFQPAPLKQANSSVDESILGSQTSSQTTNLAVVYASLLRQPAWLLAKQTTVASRTKTVLLPWKMMGIFTRVNETYILLEAKGKIQRIDMGEKLPDGSILTAIKADRIEARSGEEEKIFLLYKSDQKKN